MFHYYELEENAKKRAIVKFIQDATKTYLSKEHLNEQKVHEFLSNCYCYRYDIDGTVVGKVTPGEKGAIYTVIDSY